MYGFSHVYHKGITLIEMMVALTIGAGISLLTYQALSGALDTEKRVTEITAKTTDVSRVWQLLHNDIQHALPRPWVDELGNRQPALEGLFSDRQSQSSALSVGDDQYLLRFVRSGERAFLSQPRAQMQVVGYRIAQQENTAEYQETEQVSLWRDYWQPVDRVEASEIKSRRLLDGINSIAFRYLSVEQSSTESSAWISGWPETNELYEQLPIAIEITMDIEGIGEIVRLFSLVDTQVEQQ